MLFGGDKLYQMPSASPIQSMGYVLEGAGDVVVVDGGSAAEADQLEKKLSELGGRVSGWFLTHAHFDHIQALIEVIRRGKIVIDWICYRFPETEYIERLELRNGRVAVVRELESEIERADILRKIPEKGRPVDAGHFRFTPFSSGEACGEDLNCSSVVYRADTRGLSILFPGDMGVAGEKTVLEEFPRLVRCPVVQMAHHGQQGVDEAFYRHVAPEVCLWSTPLWLWNNDVGTGFDKGPFKTVETRSWVEKLNARNILSFDSIAVLE